MRILPVYLMVAIFVAPVLSVFGQSNFEVSFDEKVVEKKNIPEELTEFQEFFTIGGS